MNSTGMWAAIAAVVTAVGAGIAQWLAKRRTPAESDATLGHGWSEFATALREEAREERESRRLAEKEASEFRSRVSLLEEKCRMFEAHLNQLGIPLPDGG